MQMQLGNIAAPAAPVRHMHAFLSPDDKSVEGHVAEAIKRMHDNCDKIPPLGFVANGGVVECAIDFWLGKNPCQTVCNDVSS